MTCQMSLYIFGESESDTVEICRLRLKSINRSDSDSPALLLVHINMTCELGEEFDQVPRNTKVGEGEVAMMECRPPPGSPAPVVTWSKDGRQLDPAVNHRYRVNPTGELVITRARVGDSGRYTCTARNAYASRTSPPATLTVLVKPHLVSSSGDVTTESGATVELVCRVGGDPQPEVFWGRVSPSGSQLPHERLTQEERGQVLRLRHVSPEDAGVYSCTAENPVGIVAANTTLTVHSIPVFKTKPQNARVGIEGTARFECAISGSPEPTTYWTHEGSGLIVSLGQTWAGGRVSVDSLNTLTIVGVEEEDTGYYACVGVGEAGSAIARAYLEVQGVSDMPPPIIAVGASNQTLPLGTEAELPCEAKGTPEPEVAWSFEEHLIDPVSSDRHSVTPLGTLRIVDLRTSDSGIYTCTATSIAGSSQWQASLAVHKATNPNIRFYKMFWDSDLPEPPQNLMVLVINATQVTLGWSRGRSGSSSIRGHSVEYWSPDLRGPWREGTTIKPQHHIATPLGTTVTNLVPNTRYVFTVRSRNKDWVSRPAAFTNVIRTLDSGRELGVGSAGDTALRLRDARIRLNSATVRLVAVEAISSTSLKVSWRFLVSDSSILDGVYVRYRPLNSKNQPVGAISVETIRFPVRGERSALFGTNSEEVQANAPDHLSTHSKIDSSHSKFSSPPRSNLHSENNPPTSHVISNLRPATSYEIFVVPFHRSIEGQPTSSMRRTTMLAPVLAMPSGLHFKTINETCVQVGWDPMPATLEIGGRLKGYNLQGVEATNDHVLVHNSTTNATFVLVRNLKLGVAYEFSVRSLTRFGMGPPSDVLRFVPSLENMTKNVANNSIPSSTATNNTYMIVAIVCAAVLVSSFLLAAVIYIYRKQHLTKCPHYFSKSERCTGPWSGHSGCWEDGSNTGGISTTRYNDGTVSAMNNTRYTDGAPSALTNIRYTDLCGNATTIYTDGGGQFYVANDNKSGYEIRPSEDMMYEDPEGLRLVSFKGRHNQRCASPEPYATTPLISGSKDPAYPRSQKGTKMSGSRLPPNIPCIPQVDIIHNFNTQSDKGSMVSGPILQFPPPPPPPPLSAAEGGNSSTTASSNSRGGASNNAPSRGGSSQHLFLQHLPYHTTAGSNSSASHHTSPLLHPRQNRSPAVQVSPNSIKTSQISPSHLMAANNFPSQLRSQNVVPQYGQTDGDPFIHANNIIAARNQNPTRAGLENWLNSSVGNSAVENGFTSGSYFPPGKRCNSPESSAMGDAEESDDKEGDESCWSEGSHGTNDNEISTNGSVSDSMSSLNPDLNWTEAVRLMSENKWPNGSPKRPSDAAFNKFSSITDAAADNAYNPEGESGTCDYDQELKRKLLSENHNPKSCDNLVLNSGGSYFCPPPPETNDGVIGRNSSQRHDAEGPIDANKTRRHDVGHVRKTSLTSPLV
ncbi:Fibronectin type III [Trinorchestia longiramus]|nr:Fibronectin type III [Trinorchestia longiramus]